ncbi:MAG: methyltransferase domain-containing protein [Hyphomicrobium sp.]
MELDVLDLRDFYKSPLGVLVRRVLGEEVRYRWRSFKGGVVAGLGYAVPYLGSFRQDSARLAALMPENQGAHVWPSSGYIQTLLVEDRHLPLPDNSVDRLLLIHSLEGTERPSILLRELWRVLVPEGRLLIIVPNRRSVWARFDSTPFGHGRPFSRSQLERLLIEGLFTPLSWRTALHFPPINSNLLLQSAQLWEKTGSRIWPAFGGVVLMEARKEVMAPIGGKRSPVRSIREFASIVRT